MQRNTWKSVRARYPKHDANPDCINDSLLTCSDDLLSREVEHLLPKFELAGSQLTSGRQRVGVMACSGGLQGALTTGVMCKKNNVAK